MTLEVRTGKLLWDNGFEGGMPVGRGVVTSSGVMIPVTDGILSYDLVSGKRKGALMRWPDGRKLTGPITVANDMLLIAGGRFMTAFHDELANQRK